MDVQLALSRGARTAIRYRLPRSARRLLVVLLCVSGLAAMLATAVDAHAVAARTVTVYPAQTSSCATGGVNSTPSRVLVTHRGSATPCPQVAATESLRQDEQYALNQPIGGYFLPGSSAVTGTVAFDQLVQGVATPGYVDADVVVSLNGSSQTLHAAGLITPSTPYVLPVHLTVPAAIRDHPVSSVLLAITWNPGTTAGVEPTMDGTTQLSFPVYTPTLVTVRFHTTFVQNFTACPSGGFCVTGTNTVPGLGRVTMQRNVVFGNPQSGCGTKVTSTGGLGVAHQGSITISATGTFCPGDGSANYTFTVTGGTGTYKTVAGHGQIHVLPISQGLKEAWQATITYRRS